MELLSVNQYMDEPETIDQVLLESSDKGFMQANTMPINLNDLHDGCIIPSFAKDNESTISHSEFMGVVAESIESVFYNERVLKPAIRVSHPIKGRIPEAMGKPAKELLDNEITLYYERMAFIIEIPSITSNINGNEVSLTVGGVRAYNLENLSSRKTEERFKIFIGFKNKVCTNLCVSTDGYLQECKVRSLRELSDTTIGLLEDFNIVNFSQQLSELGNYALTEHQFAQLIGRMKLYQYLPVVDKKLLEPVPLNDSQVATIAKDYYNYKPFAREENGDINLWKLYNLFTGANKSSYIDTFLDRDVGSYQFIETMKHHLQSGTNSWFIS